jgi:hypothetical protein
MKIKKIVVDKLPDNCNSCQFRKDYDYYVSDCSIVHTIAFAHTRPENCPLVVEEDLCE